MTRQRCSPDRPARFDEHHAGFLLVELGLCIWARSFVLVARALRAVDDNFAEFDDPTTSQN